MQRHLIENLRPGTNEINSSLFWSMSVSCLLSVHCSWMNVSAMHLWGRQHLMCCFDCHEIGPAKRRGSTHLRNGTVFSLSSLTDEHESWSSPLAECVVLFMIGSCLCMILSCLCMTSDHWLCVIGGQFGRMKWTAMLLCHSLPFRSKNSWKGSH